MVIANDHTDYVILEEFSFFFLLFWQLIDKC